MAWRHARRLARLLRRGEATVTVADPRGYMTYQPRSAGPPSCPPALRAAEAFAAAAAGR